jgi:hypothetical protein
MKEMARCALTWCQPCHPLGGCSSGRQLQALPKQVNGMPIAAGSQVKQEFESAIRWATVSGPSYEARRRP